MRYKHTMIRRWAGVVGVAAIAAAVTLSFGCSSKPKEEEKKAAPAAPAAQQQPVDPVKAAFDKGMEQASKGELDAAIASFEEVIKLNPNIPEVYSNIGFAYYDKGVAVEKTDAKKAQGDFVKSIEYQKKALAIEKTFANAFYGLAQTLEKKGDRAGAIKNWKEFLKNTDPHNPWRARAEERLKALEGGKKKKS